MIIGFGEAIFWPAFDALYSRHLDKNKEGIQWGAWEAMSYFTAAFGAVVGGYLVTQFGFIAMFIIMGVLSFASAIYMAVLPKKLFY